MKMKYSGRKKGSCLRRNLAGRRGAHFPKTAVVPKSREKRCFIVISWEQLKAKAKERKAKERKNICLSIVILRPLSSYTQSKEKEVEAFISS